MKRISPALFSTLLLSSLFLISGCNDDDPNPENVPELITKVNLKFTPTAGGSVVTVSATDPDGEGVQDIKVDGPINLLKGVQYTLSVELLNGLYKPGEEGYDITEEVEEEGDEHQLFFGFSDGVFSSPTGTGNIKDNASSPVGSINYLDTDSDGRPLGLSTSWTTSNLVTSDKSFRVMLKHQPDLKSASTTSLDGQTDLDITFVLNLN